MALVPGKTRRAALHGLIAQAVASAITNLGFKTLLPRARPLPEHLPVFRFVHPQPTSSSMPSGHSASAVAFALGVGLVRPALGAALAPVRAPGWPTHGSTPEPTGPRMSSSVPPSVPALPLPPANGGRSGRRFPDVRRDRRRGSRNSPGGKGSAIAVNTLGGSYAAETAGRPAKCIPDKRI